MTREEFSILVKGMKAVFSDPKFIADKDAFDVWYSMLQDLDYPQANKAVQAYIMTNKFPPTIADIREKATFVSQPEEMGEIEAWNLVTKAMANGNYGASEEFAKLPPAVQKAVGNPAVIREWAQLPVDEAQTVAMSQFMRAYRSVLQRNNQVNRMSPDLQIALNEQLRIGENR